MSSNEKYIIQWPQCFGFLADDLCMIKYISSLLRNNRLSKSVHCRTRAEA